MLGLITASNTTVQNASKVATGYKSILLNLMNKDLEEQFNAFGITTKNANGTMKDGYTILEELSVKFKELGTVTDASSGELASLDNQMNALLEDIAGKYNINTLTAGLNSFDIAISATETALNSAGSAQEEFTTALASIDKKLEGIKGSFNELVTSGGLTTFVKLILDATQALLDFANSGAGKTLLTLTAILVGYKAIIAIIPVLIGLYDKVVLSMFAVTEAGLAMNTALLVPILIIGSIVAVVAIYEKLNVTLEENQERLSELQEEYDSATSAVETTSKSLESVRDRIEEINALDAIDTVTQDELDNLLLEEARLEGILAIEKERLRLAQPELEAQAKKTVEDKVTNYYGDTQTSTRYSQGEKYTTTTYEETDRVQALKDASTEMEKQTSILNHLNEVEQTNGYLTEAETLAKQNAVRAYDEASDSVSQYAVDLQSEISGLDESSATRAYAQEGIDAYTDALNQNSEATTENTDTTSDSTDTWQTAALELEDLADAYSDVKSEMSDMFSTYSDLSSMVDEYNSSNGASYENILELIEVADQYNGLLEFQDGQLAINTEAGNAYAQSKIDEAKATLTANTQKELEIILSGAVADAETDTAKQSLIAGEAILTAAQTAYEGVPYLSETTKAWMYMLDSLGGTDGITAETQAQIDALGESYFTQMKLLDGLSGSVGNYTSSADGASSATSKLKTEMKSFEASVDSQISSLEDAKDAIDKYYDDEIDKLKDLQDASDKYYDDEIEKVEDLQDATNKYYEDEIDRVEKLQDVTDEYYDDEIDNLKTLQDEEEAYWDEKINALKDINEELDDQYELNRLLENQASVTKTKVLSGGEWTYVDNEQESTDAQLALDKYYREQAYKDELEALEKSKEDALAVYDKKIADLEKYQEEAKEQFDKQIEDLKELKESLDEEYDAQIEALKDLQEALDEEYDQKIEDLKDLQEATLESYEQQIKDLESYKEAQLANYQSQLDNLADYGNSVIDAHKSLNASEASLYEQSIAQYKAYQATMATLRAQESASNAELDVVSNVNDAITEKLSAKKLGYASGTPSIKEDQIAFVGDTPNGDRPNQELVIGAKYNKSMGIPMNLQKGTGILPAKQTRTLTGMLMNMASNGSTYSPVANTNSKSVDITISHLELPSVSNGDEFVDYLMNFETQMIQSSYNRG